jgi:hypothetical protein
LVKQPGGLTLTQVQLVKTELGKRAGKLLPMRPWTAARFEHLVVTASQRLVVGGVGAGLGQGSKCDG